MCGIAGILNFDPNRSADADLLSRMTRALTHRGPDGEGFYADGPVGLGHRRLSIIDLAGGAQPLSNEDGTVWISFNGEIFNFKDLRRLLEAAGHRFKTESDTECIVHLYEEYGTGCAEHLVGQFAFAIWDRRKRRLFLARDHVGIKPLFYHLDGTRLLFASEMKAILEEETIDREMDLEALVEYLSYCYIPAPRTIFRSIRKLPAGHWLLWEKDRVRTERFWEMPHLGEPPASEEECAQRVGEMLREAVKGQLMSDVPLGAFLSGGVDSSIIVGLMSELTGRPVKTFTIGFREEDFSELPFARKVAEKYQTEHHELIVEPESVDLLPRLVSELDEPFADPASIPTYYVCRLAREHVTVCLSGDGGDEGFAGYLRYQWALKYAKLDGVPAGLRRVFFGQMARLLSGRYGKAAERLSLDPATRYGDFMGYLRGPALHGLLSPDVERSTSGRPDLARILELDARVSRADYLTRLQYIDIQTYLPDDILVKTDRMSMLNSLEVRVPFVDHRILEYAATIPSAWRLGKGILKRAMEPLLPPEVLTRRKMGFGVPLKHWFRGDWREYTRDLLLGKRARERGLLDARKVNAMADGYLNERGVKTTSMYTLVVLEEWCRQYLDQPQRTK